MKLNFALATMLSALGQSHRAFAFVGPRISAPSVMVLRGGSTDAAVAETATESTTRELYNELVKKLETITHLGTIGLCWLFHR